MAALPSRRPVQPRLAAAPDSPSTPLTVFLTNLHLLDLDLLPDWPAISAATFATSGAGVQGQKRRIQCVEWVLFRLFSLWDPQEAADKLQPFFPPLDQMQSLNLRAALLRALDAAKKNGVLGRDAVIRKTMLDECKGQRLEEALACFSTAVLKRLVAQDAARASHPPPLAAGLVLEELGYQADNSELVALTLAHRFSLRRFLESKDVARARYRDFSHLLNAKERAMAQRNHALGHLEHQGEGVSVSEAACAEMRRTIRNNWSGNESWAGVLLGDSVDASRGLLSEPFDRVWRRIEQGRVAELEEDGRDLLEQLENRVRIQRERLDGWEAFRAEAFRRKHAQAPTSPPVGDEAGLSRGIDLAFVHHQNLQFERAARVSGIRRGEQPLARKHAGLVSELRDELARIRSPSIAPSSFASRARHPSHERSLDLVPGIDGPNDDRGVEPTGDSAWSESEIRRRLPERGDAGTASAHVLGLPQPALAHHDMYALDRFRRDDPWETSDPPSPSLRPPSVKHAGLAGHELAANSPLVPSPAEKMADGALESMKSSSLSPNKCAKPRHMLSLAQRTRLSMARADNMFLDEPDSPLERDGWAAEAESSPSPDQDVAEDLVSRTRRSMAGFEKAKHKAQLERRRSQRKSRAPPAKAGSFFPAVEEEGAPQTEHAVCEEDMEDVFRSRPKIKASPIPSPTRDLSQDAGEYM